MPNTPNLDLEKPAHSDPDWDTPVNSNWDKIDEAVGASSEIEYAENVSVTGITVAGTSTAVGTAVDVTSLSISVPASARPVYLEAGFTYRQSALGNGEAVIQIKETTSGTTDVEWAYRTLPNSTSLRGRNNTISVRVRLGTTVATRTFKVMARCDSVDATVPSFVVLNTAAARSFLRAWSE